MRVICLVLCLTAVVLSSPVQDKWNKVHRSCQSVPAFFVEEIIFEKLKKGEQVSLPDNFGLHAHCMLEKLGLQNSQGAVQRNALEQTVRSNIRDASQANKVIDECFVNKGSKEDTALELFGCLGKNKVNIGQL